MTWVRYIIKLSQIVNFDFHSSLKCNKCLTPNHEMYPKISPLVKFKKIIMVNVFFSKFLNVVSLLNFSLLKFLSVASSAQEHSCYLHHKQHSPCSALKPCFVSEKYIHPNSLSMPILFRYVRCDLFKSLR